MFTKKLILLAILTAVLFSSFTVNTMGATKTVTANGNAQIVTAQSKFGGASGLFDGSGDYLSTPDSVDWYFGTGDFTIDFWVRFNALPTSGTDVRISGQNVGAYNDWWLAMWNNGGTYTWKFATYTLPTNNPIAIPQATTMSVNTWYHVALVRSGNTWYWFQNGNLLGTGASNTNPMNDYSALLTIGGRSDGHYLNGWIDEFRISKGVARWTTTFTPPSSQYTMDSYTALLLHCDGADSSTVFIDSSSTPSTPDFTILPSKSTISTTPGSSDASTITVTSILGFSDDVTLSSSWIGTTPSGVTVAFTPTTVTPTPGGTASTMNVDVDTFSSTGTYNLQVTGTAGSITHSTTISLTISAQPGTYNFKVRAGATKITVTCTWSNSGSITISLVSPPSTTYNEPDMAIYEKTTIAAGSTTSYNYLKRAQLPISPPSQDQTWLVQLTTAVTSYTVDIEVT